MYFQKDYVLRMIEMMGDLVRRICSIAREADARAELDTVAQRACGLPMEMLREGEPHTLEALMDEPRRYFAAELLLIAVEVERRTHADEELIPFYTQALALYATLADDYAKPAADRAGRIVRENLPLLPADALKVSAGLFERTGQYALAEDAWFAAVELSPDDAPKAEAFLLRLAVLDAHRLRSGGLSPDEVTEALRALKR